MRTMLTVRDLREILEKYPDDVKIAIGVEPDDELGLYYNVQVNGLDTGNNKLLCFSSKDLSLDLSFWKSSYEEGWL